MRPTSPGKDRPQPGPGAPLSSNSRAPRVPAASAANTPSLRFSRVRRAVATSAPGLSADAAASPAGAAPEVGVAEPGGTGVVGHPKAVAVSAEDEGKGLHAMLVALLAVKAGLPAGKLPGVRPRLRRNFIALPAGPAPGVPNRKGADASGAGAGACACCAVSGAAVGTSAPPTAGAGGIAAVAAAGRRTFRDLELRRWACWPTEKASGGSWADSSVGSGLWAYAAGTASLQDALNPVVAILSTVEAAACSCSEQGFV